MTVFILLLMNLFATGLLWHEILGLGCRGDVFRA